MGVSRRAFASLAAAAAFSPALPAQARSTMKLIKPPRLAPGDTVAILAPSGRTNEAAVERCVRNLETLGFRARVGANILAQHGNYAGSVAERVADLHAALLDPAIKAIWAVRGGSGGISALPYIDYKLVRAHPKALIGYSDITTYHYAFLRQAGVVSFHGPVLGSSHPSEFSMAQLMALLCDPQPSMTLPLAPENIERARDNPLYAARTIHSGVATGPLLGGNLSLVAALAGTPYGIDFKDHLLFLEDVNEPPYKIDRMMTQLDLAYGFDRARALIVGVCEECGPKDADPALSFEQTMDLHLQPRKIPTVIGYSFGHIRDQITLPMGIQARLDTEAQTLTLLEPAVA
ncbi:LD-carboxypeptidase [Massilia sp. TS11]|uniref:S66 peptidase family protein n=1 Tax=Massilia sp. TS11 TaxID=2908003 RepID=UPI001EDB17D8|nr:LD-carboxypeptidase [Massilia sp. TS11]MCG2585150.1 LD-carboxypeptidase [Massilia sp. TS11]